MKIAVANIAARVRFLLNRVQERLWVKPLLFSVLSIAVVFGARLADHTGLDRVVPQISKESVDTLLSVMASGMLVMATFAVGSMVAAYASASNTASPRSFCHRLRAVHCLRRSMIREGWKRLSGGDDPAAKGVENFGCSRR